MRRRIHIIPELQTDFFNFSNFANFMDNLEGTEHIGTYFDSPRCVGTIYYTKPQEVVVHYEEIGEMKRLNLFGTEERVGEIEKILRDEAKKFKIPVGSLTQ